MSALRRSLIYLLAILLVGATYWLHQRCALANDPAIAILYLPAIILASYIGGLGAGLLATVAALLASHALLVDFDSGSFNTNLADRTRWLVLLISGLLVSLLNTRARLMERKLAQTAALTESEARYRGIVQDQTELISRFNRKGKLTYVNDVYCRFFGRSSEDLIGKHWSPLAAPDDLERIEAELDRLALDRPVITLEYRVSDAAGRLRWMQFVYRALFDADGHRVETQAIGRDITTLRETLQELDESSKRMQALFDTSQDGITLLDQHGHLREANASFARMLEYNPEEMAGLSVWDWDAQWSRPELEDQFHLLDPTPRSFETRHRRKDGSVFPVEINVTPIRFKGELLYYAFSRDISARKQLETSLRESEALYRSVVACMEEGVCVQDAHGAITALNPAAEHITGRKAEQILSYLSVDPHWGAIQEDGSTFPGIEQPPMLTLSTGKPVSDVVMGIHRPNGSLRWIIINSQPLIADGELAPYAVVSTFRDITEQKCSEDKLREAASVFEAAGEGIIITDRNARIIDVNPAFTAITGYTRAEVLGKNPRILKSGHHGQEFYAKLWQCLMQSGHWQGEIWNRYKDGQLHAEALTITAMRNGAGNVSRYIALFSEITARKQEQEALAHRAFHDALTGLPNRALLYDRLGVSLASARRNGKQLAVCYLDLDGFKPVNDRYGHEVGDLLLMELARRLIATTRSQDTVSRLGGDEFVLLLNELASEEEGLIILGRVQAAVAEPYQLGPQHTATISASVGVSYYPSDGTTSSQLLTYADQAMYQAKLNGRNRVCRFDPKRMTGSPADQIAP